jgi:hypothetical protein
MNGGQSPLIQTDTVNIREKTAAKNGSAAWRLFFGGGRIHEPNPVCGRDGPVRLDCQWKCSAPEKSAAATSNQTRLNLNRRSGTKHQRPGQFQASRLWLVPLLGNSQDKPRVPCADVVAVMVDDFRSVANWSGRVAGGVFDLHKAVAGIHS